MERYIDKKYGADSDGNRGIKMVEYELDSTDYEDVREAIKEYIRHNHIDDVNNLITIYLLEPWDGTEVEFDVFITDYLDKKEIQYLIKGKQNE